MTSYERNKTYILGFTDPELEGLHVATYGVSAGAMLDVVDLVGVLSGGEVSISDMHEVDKLFRVFAGCPANCESEHRHYRSRIKEWNLTEGGQPVPPTYEGLVSQDFDFALMLAMAWIDGIVGTPGPLEENSNDGGPSVEELMPMAEL